MDEFLSHLTCLSTNQNVLFPWLTRFSLHTCHSLDSDDFNCEVFVQMIKSHQNPPQPVAALESVFLQLFKQCFASEMVPTLVELQETGMMIDILDSSGFILKA